MEGMMRRILVFGFVLSILLFAGCGEDGTDGDAFLAYNWVYTPLYVADTIPDLPDIVYAGKNYNVSPGTYSCVYTAWDGSSYSGTITIYIDEGEEGGWIRDGDDGDDNFFELFFYATGPAIDFKQLNVVEELLKAGTAVDESALSNKIKISSMEEFPSTPSDSEVHVIEKQQGKFNMRLEYQRISK
jgi:hypothetical protein